MKPPGAPQPEDPELGDRDVASIWGCRSSQTSSGRTERDHWVRGTSGEAHLSTESWCMDRAHEVHTQPYNLEHSVDQQGMMVTLHVTHWFPNHLSRQNLGASSPWPSTTDRATGQLLQQTGKWRGAQGSTKSRSCTQRWPPLCPALNHTHVVSLQAVPARTCLLGPVLAAVLRISRWILLGRRSQAGSARLLA